MNNVKETIKPEVGMGITECWFSDCHPGTISRISPSGKTIWYKTDDVKVVKGSCQDGSAEYEYTENPKAREVKATLRKNGQWRSTGTNCFIALGHRREYYDPSF